MIPSSSFQRSRYDVNVSSKVQVTVLGYVEPNGMSGYPVRDRSNVREVVGSDRTDLFGFELVDGEIERRDGSSTDVSEPDQQRRCRLDPLSDVDRK